MQVFLSANTLLVEFMAKVHPIQKKKSAAGWRGSKCSHLHAQGIAPGKNAHSNHLKSIKWYSDHPWDTNRTASVLLKREQILTGLQRGSSSPLQGTAKDFSLSLYHVAACLHSGAGSRPWYLLNRRQLCWAAADPILPPMCQDPASEGGKGWVTKHRATRIAQT